MSVGQSLTEAREARGLSVEDVSAQTRIRATLIRDIEADDYHSCGGDVYARGHIRSIARSVGMDPAPLLEEFDRSHSADIPVIAAAPLQAGTDQQALANSERRGPNWTAAAVAALVLIIAIAGYSLIHGSGGTAGRSNAGKGPGATTPSSAPASTPAAPSSPGKNTTAELPSNKAIMQVRATNAETWLEIKNAHGVVLFEGDLMPGQHKTESSASALDFVIGNAPAVDVVINGKDVGSPKATGVVARGRVVPGSRQIQQA